MAIEVHRLPVGRGRYERLPDEAADNTELSIAALGLLWRLLRDGHSFNSIDAIADYYARNDGEARKRGRGRDAYREAAKELEAAGYLVRIRTAVNGVPAIRIQVFAEPNETNVRVLLMTAKPSSERPAETSHKPSSARTTAQPLSSPPAETPHKPRSRRTTAEPSSFLTDSSPDLQTSSPYPLNGHDQGREPREDGGGGSGSKDENQTQADALVAALPIDIQQIDQQRRRKLYAGVVAALAAGWTDADLKQELQREMANARSPIGVWLARLKPENLGPPRKLTAVPEPRKPVPKCPWCDQGGRWYRSGDDLIGLPCTHPAEPPPGHPEHHATTKENAA